MKEIPAELLEQYRYVNVDYRGWDKYERDEFISSMSKFGIDIDELLYDTSFCQGSGASCTGVVEPLTFIRARRLDGDEYDDVYGVVRLVLERDMDALAFNLYRTDHRYAHEYTISIQADDGSLYPSDVIDTTNSPILESLVPQWDDTYDVQVGDLGDEILRFVRERLKEFHRHMQDIVLDLTSDAAVEDFIRYNVDEYMEDTDAA